MRWVCIVLPQLALDAVLRASSEPEAPLALITGTAQRRVVQAVNDAARELGLQAGQSLTTALALSRDFTQVEYDHGAIARWHQFLAAWAYSFSSQVSLRYPRALLLEIESSLALFGPWPRFEARLRSELTALGFRHRLVAAPNPVAARMLANAYDGLAVSDSQMLHEVLARMPLNRLGLDSKTASALARMGLRTVQQVLALPRHTLAKRFDAGLLLHLDTLLGQRAVALECYQPPEQFEVRIELNFDVESNQALLFPLRRLTADLAAFLAGRDSGVLGFVVHLEHVDGSRSQVDVGLLSAEREPNMLFDLARGRLERLLVQSPVRAVSLQAKDLPAFVPEHRELFDERPQQSVPWQQLRERLRARLGDEAVQGIQAHADHRPECAWQATAGSKPPLLGDSPPRPGWLLSEAQALRERAPQILAGPERIESGWWDGGDVRRDYYLLLTRSGQRVWAYRTVSQDEPGPFMVHGWFS
ncbi:Y-family DNA polymerase [Pseudomonas turukhanskensis]|uniref:DNA repair nucleotidyltransferase n=1 Tax=Pseudomonas turukhanskensis TaxID=1806536 RepID=A0A9W6NIC0_9PSED|nr:DNA polymerase Y family protein [Pseudomonas turukhanskensis]GLK91661.1 DNA repair nucleotidyltransferase [Pseudomonas turukhanskensis]